MSMVIQWPYPSLRSAPSTVNSIRSIHTRNRTTATPQPNSHSFKNFLYSLWRLSMECQRGSIHTPHKLLIPVPCPINVIRASAFLIYVLYNFFPKLFKDKMDFWYAFNVEVFFLFLSFLLLMFYLASTFLAIYSFCLFKFKKKMYVNLSDSYIFMIISKSLGILINSYI